MRTTTPSRRIASARCSSASGGAGPDSGADSALIERAEVVQSDSHQRISVIFDEPRGARRLVSGRHLWATLRRTYAAAPYEHRPDRMNPGGRGSCHLWD